MTKKIKLSKMKKKAFVTTVPTTSPLAPIHEKFKRIQEIRKQLSSLKDLYVEHDRLTKEILPLFIQTTPEKFEVLRELKLGNKTYRLTPYFFNAQKSELQAKVWKSTAHETFTVEF